MKKSTTTLVLFLTLIAQGCFFPYGEDDDDLVVDPYESMYEPVTLSREELENSIKLTEPRIY